MNSRFVLSLAFALAVGASTGYWYAKQVTPTEPPVEARKPLYYRSPMNPAVTSPVPARSRPDSSANGNTRVYALRQGVRLALLVWHTNNPYWRRRPMQTLATVQTGYSSKLSLPTAATSFASA